jgi:hypothetical protein
MSDARRIRVAIVSHAYTASENRKNIAALVQHADVRVVMPRDMPQTVLTGWVDEQGRRHDTEGGGPATVDSGLAGDAATPYRPHPRIQLFGAQYLLRSWSFGLREFEPDVIHVDYDPWATIFLQTLHARRVSAPKARLVITSRKNTYRRYPGALGRAKHELAMFGVPSSTRRPHLGAVAKARWHWASSAASTTTRESWTWSKPSSGCANARAATWSSTASDTACTTPVSRRRRKPTPGWCCTPACPTTRCPHSWRVSTCTPCRPASCRTTKSTTRTP